MFSLVVGFIAIIVLIAGPFFFKIPTGLQFLIRASCVPVAIMAFVFGTSYSIAADKSGVVVRHVGPNLPIGNIIATHGEQGTQAEILGPGWHFGYWPFIYEVEEVPTLTIKQGQIGFVNAKDGKALPDGVIFAEPWESPQDMLNPVNFLAGHGQRGPQMSILPPGTYRYNPYLHEVSLIDPVNIAPGTVGVIKSNTGEIVGRTESADSVNGVMLVADGQRGIWKKPLTPGSYYLNTIAQQVTTVKTTNRVYTYQAAIARTANNAGNQKSSSGATNQDWSITVRSKDGFNFPIDVRVSCAVTAQDAPYLVAMLGNPDQVVKDTQEDEELEVMEAKVILPTVRAVFRNVAENMNALEFVNARSKVEAAATEAVRAELIKSRVILHEVFIGNIHMDATDAGRKLMETQTEKELASNQQILYSQQQAAEVKRAELVKAQSEADRQKDLVQAQFEIQINESRAKAAVAAARGEAEASVARAEGESKAQVLLGKGRAEAYKAMVESLGANQFTQLESLKAIAEGKILPGVITPQILMTGASSPMDALGATMLRNQTNAAKP